MAKQTRLIKAQCGHRLKRGGGRCINNATIGTFHWNPGETDVNLDNPQALRCGEHKIKLSRNWPWRNVRIRTV